MSSYIEKYYVVEDLESTSCIHSFNSLREAVEKYQSLPTTQMKALGVQNTHAPYVGCLDFIQCRDGRDFFVQDYLQVPTWDNPEIHFMLQQLHKYF